MSNAFIKSTKATHRYPGPLPLIQNQLPSSTCTFQWGVSVTTLSSNQRGKPTLCLRQEKSESHCTQFFRGYYSRVVCFRGGSVFVVSFRFKAKEYLQRCGDVFFDILWLQARKLRLSVCLTTFQNFNRSLNKRRMSPAQTITTEWTEEKCLDKRVQSK